MLNPKHRSPSLSIFEWYYMTTSSAFLPAQEDISQLDDDLMNIYGVEDEYHDDDEWFHPTQVPNKPPPPYPGTADHQGNPCDEFSF